MTVNEAISGHKYYVFTVMYYLCPEQDRSIMVETLGGFSSTFKLVPENCVCYVLQPAEKPPLRAAYSSV